jgi:hypothetical protein
VGQIHDSLIGDVHRKEARDYSEIVEEITMHRLPKKYPWLAVPPEIEYEACPIDGNWHQKQGFKFKDGRFLHPTKEGVSTIDPEKFLKTIKVK